MKKKVFAASLFAVIGFGTLALVSPATPVQAKECVICPQIGILCGDCYRLVPQNCQRCAHCERIPGCH